jgi:hypothetical protein
MPPEPEGLLAAPATRPLVLKTPRRHIETHGTALSTLTGPSQPHVMTPAVNVYTRQSRLTCVRQLISPHSDFDQPHKPLVSAAVRSYNEPNLQSMSGYDQPWGALPHAPCKRCMTTRSHRYATRNRTNRTTAGQTIPAASRVLTQPHPAHSEQ